MDIAIDWFRNLLEDQDRLDEMKETARIYFAGDDVTVNLIPATIILLLLALVLKPLFGIPLLDNILGAMSGHGGGGASYGGGVSSGYGAPDAGYGAPDAGYGAPEAGYGAPDAGYGAPSSGYDSPSSGYDAPQSGYNPGSDYSAPSSGYNSVARFRRSPSQLLSQEQRAVNKELQELQGVPQLADSLLLAPLAANLGAPLPAVPLLQ